MRKLLTIALLLVVVFALATNVNAATKSELSAYLTKTHTVAGEEVSLSESDKVKVERYLSENDVTEEQADKIIAKVDEAIAVMNEAGVSDITKLSKEDKEKLVNIANEAASVLGLTISYDASTKTISIYKDGKLIESTSITSNSKLVQTGSSNIAYIAVPVVAIIAIAMVAAYKKAKNA